MLKRCMRVIVFVLATVMLTSSIIVAKAINPGKTTEPTETIKTVNFVEKITEIKEVKEFKENQEVEGLGQLMAEKVIEVEEAVLFKADFSDRDLEALCQTLYGEANCVKSDAERSMVVWTILNRYDAGFGETIYEICTAEYQFTGYDPDNPVTDRNMALVMDVIGRWEREKNGETDVGRTLPREFCFFVADSNPSAGEWHNAFYAYSEGNRGYKIWYDYRHPASNPY